MRRVTIFLLALSCSFATFVEAISYPEVVIGENLRGRFFNDKVDASFCLNPTRGRRSALCTLTFDRVLPAPGHDLIISTAEICRTIRGEGGEGRIWNLSPVNMPGYFLYEIDCRMGLARPLMADAHSDVTAQSPVAPPGSLKPSQGSGRPPMVVHENGMSSSGVGAGDAPEIESLRREILELQQKIERLRQEFLEELKTLREENKASCFRVEDKPGSRDEVMVAVEGSVLRFLKIPSASVTLGLSEEAANELHSSVQDNTTGAVVPRIFLSVGNVTRDVGEFYMQDRLVPEDLYRRISGDKDAHRVSYQEARGFIDKVNEICAGRARFDLPTEEQFLAAARRVLYDPVNNGLKPCATLTDLGGDIQVYGLLGNFWQLTSSPCEPFDGQNPAGLTCPQGSYIRKGGTKSSENPLECVPEYRSPSPAEVAQKDTAFRLVLAE